MLISDISENLRHVGDHFYRLPAAATYRPNTPLILHGFPHNRARLRLGLLLAGLDWISPVQKCLARKDTRPSMNLTIARAYVLRLTAAAVALTLLAGAAVAQDAKRARTALPALKAWTGDLDGMKSRRVVRILVPYSKTIYFIDKGCLLYTSDAADE